MIDSNEKVIYIDTPLISVIIHEKDWDDRLALINLHYIIDVYKYYISSGYKKNKIKEEEEIFFFKVKVNKTLKNG